METVYIPNHSLCENPEAARRLALMEGVTSRFGQGYPDGVSGMWIDENSPAHSLAILLGLEIK